MSEATETALISDALPLEIVDLDGHKVTFIWFYLGGVDRLTVDAEGRRLGVVERLESTEPRLLPDLDWSAWLECDQRTDRLVAQAKRQWEHRGEIVADQALHEGGQQ